MAGNKWEKFLLLIWKNFLLQWRHRKQTVLEILAPVLFCSLLIIIRSLVDPEPHAARFYDTFEIAMPILGNITTLKFIAWSPQNELLENIMNDTLNAISQDEGYIMNHIPFENSKALGKYLNNELNSISTLAGVQFDDSLANATNLTSHVDITIRFPGELRSGIALGAKGFGQYTWKTNLLFPLYQMAGPRGWDMNEGAEPSYHYEGFLKLQKELSYSIINHFKQIEYKQSFNRTSAPVVMQRFPYPKWINDLLLTALQTFVGLIIMLSFVYTCISTVRMITTEKEKQLKESMKIMGLPNWLHWTAWFVKSFFLMLITIILIVILMKAKWYPGKDYTVFYHSNPLIIFLFLIFYVCATITFCFAISVFFSRANLAATIAGMAWFISYFPYSFLQDKYDTLSLSQKLFTCLFSNSAMAYGFQLMIMYEGIGEGLQWHNIWKTTSPDDTLKLGHLMVMLIVDTFLYLLIALYIEAIFPGDYGIAKPWYFPFQKSFWYQKHKYVGIETIHSIAIKDEFYEQEPTNLECGIQIIHLRKEFGSKKVAVRDLSLNMFKDQITVLLGHNGAGKTTTMSMLTGIIQPTSGTALINGYDIRTDMKNIRESLGLCPQHNILFDELTVVEHLYFYSRLKGLSKEETEKEIKNYLILLELEPKANAASYTLSGGMKRKLSVGVALCGGSNIVMFDEPTAGMDPSARRTLWDLLQSQKKGRTILLTTHFMDEADLLGDRIAIMAGGKLQCCGSSFFLKKKYGAGYHLIMDKSRHCNVDNVTNLLRKYIPDIEVESNVGRELSYILSEKQSSIFENMFRDLEENSNSLGVISYGISLTTLEEVFMKVGADHGQEEYHNEIENTETSNEIGDNNINDNSYVERNTHKIPVTMKEINLLVGTPLQINQFQAMLMKRGLSILRSWVLLIVQICIPVAFLVMAIVVVRGANIYRDLPRLKISLNSYDHPVTVISSDPSNKYTEEYIKFFNKDNKKLIQLKDANVSQYMYEQTMWSPPMVRLRYIIGATFEKNNIIKAWFNNEPYHSPPLTLQSAMNSILQKEVSPKHTIQIYNFPLPFTLNTKFADLARGRSMGFQIAFNIGFSMAFVSSFYVMFYVRERVCKAKHLQFVSGVGVMAFWSSSFICDMLTFSFTSLCIIITLVIFQEDGFTTPMELGRTFSILSYFGFSMLPMMYLSSFFFDIPSAGYTRMTLINIFTGVAGFLIVQVLGSPGLDLEHVADTLHWIFLLIPHYSLSSGIRDMNLLYSIQNLCSTMLESCIHFDLPGFKPLTPRECKIQICRAQFQCCSIPTDYYSWKEPGIGRNVVFSCSVGIVLITILLLIEYRVFEKIYYRIREKNIQPPSSVILNEDSDVRKEKNKIQNFSIHDISNYSLVMRNVTKYYNKFLAVNRISLAVKKYECFGLLGINGAGKTTTFKMMTGDVELSFGDAWVNAISLKTNMKRIHQLIGYCPQFDALLDDLTCRETIIIFSLLRGFTMEHSKQEAIQLAEEFDFYRHLNKKVKELSGGNKRKLSTAVSMIGDPLVLYLDEPTTGMDPATKRFLWNALCKIRDRGTSIILTSHSMEECEALCTRLAIMVNGSFMCLGSTQHLKSKFSDGYTLIIKVKDITHGRNSDLHDSETKAIEDFVIQNFHNAVLRENYQKLLTFYISDTSIPWSRMFGILEQGKQELHIEDYSLGQSSLEQVFLTFTKYQQDEHK